MAICPEFGEQLAKLWYEFEEKESIEAKVAKAADGMCPIFLRLQSKQSYLPFTIQISHLEKIKYPQFVFSKTFSALYQRLKNDLLSEKLIST
jgi:putative hydrolase of HD superfamily